MKRIFVAAVLAAMVLGFAVVTFAADVVTVGTTYTLKGRNKSYTITPITFSITSAGSVELVAATAGKKTCALSWGLSSTGDTNAQFLNGAAVMGNAPLWSTTLNWGAKESARFLDGEPVRYFCTSANTALNINSSAALANALTGSVEIWQE